MVTEEMPVVTEASMRIHLGKWRIESWGCAVHLLLKHKVINMKKAVLNKILEICNSSVLPADIVGFNMYQKETGQFVYHPGTIMCNLFLADEINRTSPKTQSALLEVMEEGKVTVDGVSRKVPQPFVVIATQNPKGSAGTQLLPESQLDRFMTCMSMGYPDLQSEMEIAQGKTMTKAEDLQPVLLPEQLWEMQQYVEQIYVHDNVAKYIVQLMEATRKNAYIELGVSPRGTIACVRLAKAWAFLQGRKLCGFRMM